MNLKFLLVKDYKQQQKLLLEPEDQEPFQCVCWTLDQLIIYLTIEYSKHRSAYEREDIDILLRNTSHKKG